MGDISINLLNSIETALKVYRQSVQKELAAKGIDMTLDQWMVMRELSGNPELRQYDIAERLSKEPASVTRMIDLLFKKGFIERTESKDDRRRTTLAVTLKGESVFERAGEIISAHREAALKGIKPGRMKRVRKVMKMITKNCR